MDHPKETKQVHIIGGKSGIEKCLETMTGTQHDIQDVITVFSLSSGMHTETSDDLMANMKEHQMECDNSFDLSEPSSATKRSLDLASTSAPRMKRLKSLDRNDTHRDVGYESDSNESEENKETNISICAIDLEDGTGLTRKLVSYVYKMLVWPALILLPIGSDHFNLELYTDILTELGIYASGAKVKSKLMVVGMSYHNTEVRNSVDKHAKDLHFTIWDSYFGRNFDFCEVDILKDKLKEFSNWNGSGAKFCQSDISRNDENSFPTFELVNKFHSMLIEILQMEPGKCTLNMRSIFDHIKIDNSKIYPFIEALEGLCLVHMSRNKMMTLIPLVHPKNIPPFKQEDYEVDTNPLLITFSLDVIPAVLKGNIIKIFLDKDWSVHSSGPECVVKDSIVLTKKSQGIVIQFESSNQNPSTVCLCGLKDRKSKSCSSHEEYQNLKKCIENELKIFAQRMGIEDNIVKFKVKMKDEQNLENLMTTDEREWIEVEINDVDQRIASNVSGYLSPWFTSEIDNIERQLSLQMNDAVLSEIANLFGKGYFLFFVSQRIPEVCLYRIDSENPKSIKDAVFRMLKEWQKEKGNSGNLAVLRSALKESTHVIVDLNAFDDIVRKH